VAALKEMHMTEILDAPGPPTPPVAKFPFQAQQWGSYLRVDLGGYEDPLRTDVVAYFVFDSQEELIEIAVKKFVDST